MRVFLVQEGVYYTKIGISCINILEKQYSILDYIALYGPNAPKRPVRDFFVKRRGLCGQVKPVTGRTRPHHSVK